MSVQDNRDFNSEGFILTKLAGAIFDLQILCWLYHLILHHWKIMLRNIFKLRNIACMKGVFLSCELATLHTFWNIGTLIYHINGYHHFKKYTCNGQPSRLCLVLHVEFCKFKYLFTDSVIWSHVTMVQWSIDTPWNLCYSIWACYMTIYIYVLPWCSVTQN